MQMPEWNTYNKMNLQLHRLHASGLVQDCGNYLYTGVTCHLLCHQCYICSSLVTSQYLIYSMVSNESHPSYTITISLPAHTSYQIFMFTFPSCPALHVTDAIQGTQGPQNWVLDKMEQICIIV